MINNNPRKNCTYNFAKNISLKSFSATFFVLLYILAMTRPVMPLVEYLINEDYIAEFLCINKDKVELQCNGKCYLMQKLQEQNDEKKQNLPKIAMEEYPIGFVSFTAIVFQTKRVFNASIESNYLNRYSYQFCRNSFHPPNFIV